MGHEPGSTRVLHGSCACGSVKLSLDPAVPPSAQCWCHCSDCRRYYNGALLSPLAMWPITVLGSALKLKEGEDKLAKTELTAGLERKFCRFCGSPVLSLVRGRTVVVPPWVFPDFSFTPTLHLHYSGRKFQVHDGLTKFQDIPKEWGGQGKKLTDAGEPIEE